MKTNFVLSALASLVSASFAHATAQPACTVEALTKQCDFFKQRAGEKSIQLGDGTEYPNPFYVPLPQAASQPPTATYASGESTEAMKEAQQKILRNEVAALQVWDALPEGKKPSDEFKIAFNKILGTTVVSLAIEGESTVPASFAIPVQLPWPPTDSDSKVQRVEAKTLGEYLKSLPETSWQKLLSLSKDQVALMSQAFGGYVATTPSSAAETKVGVQVTDENKKRVMEIAKYAKNALLDEILRGRSYESLNADEKSQFQKINQVGMADFAESADLPACNGVTPNAFYITSAHKIVICPSLARYPSSHLALVLAHEMAHSIDSCCMHYPLIKVNRSKVASISMNATQMPETFKKNPDRQTVHSMLTNTEDLSNLQLNFLISAPTVVKEMEAEGYFETLAQGIPHNRNPQLATYNCLANLGNYRRSTPEERQATAREFADYIQAKNKAKNRTEIEQMTREFISRYPDCNGNLSGLSMMSEVMADAWASKVVGRWLTDYPPQNESEKIALIGIFVHGVCKDEPFTSKIYYPTNIVAVAKLRTDQSHGDPISRFNDIFLTEPRVQAALGCKPDSNKICMRGFGTLGKFKSSQENSAPRTERGVTK